MFSLKEFLKQNLPFLQRLYERWRYRNTISKTHEEIFTEYYQNNYWRDSESVSGQGSNYQQTQKIREVLPKLFEELKIKSVLDIPCGDFNWMKNLTGYLEQYYGMDIVIDIIQQNQLRFASEKIHFKRGDITKDELPAADLVLVRDLFIHFSDVDVWKSIENIKTSGSKYLLATTFTGRKSNYNIHTGSWRPLNLQKSPFNFPDSIRLINEECSEHSFQYSDKSLGLWDIAALPSLEKKV